jgi:hypothetical protein
MKMTIDLQPFQTPNFVIGKTTALPRGDGWHPSPKWSLKEVDAETLARMCDEFRAEVFKKAGKIDPHGKNAVR